MTTLTKNNEIEARAQSSRWSAYVELTKMRISVMVLFIIAASVTFAQILAFSGATNGLLAVIDELSLGPFVILLAMLLVLLFLGCFMDQVSMILITLPFFIPLAQSLGLEMVWFGVSMLIVMEISFTTPPFGLLIYVLRGVAPDHISIGQVYKAALPFIVLELMVLALIVVACSSCAPPSLWCTTVSRWGAVRLLLPGPVAVLLQDKNKIADSLR